MPTFLFNEIIFGPVQSRRLGSSLGINLLPLDSKLCNFNCLYCECGLSDFSSGGKNKLPTRKQVKIELEATLKEFSANEKPIDTITFAGNGEPTLHPDFPGIIDDAIELRNLLFPKAKLAVLSNATLIDRQEIRRALEKIEYNILKLDSVKDETIQLLNCPKGKFSAKELIRNLSGFNNLTIQTLFIKGEYNGQHFDNSGEEELELWLETIKELKPELVMIYTIARDTPIDTLEKIPATKLKEIAERVQKLGIATSVSD